MGYESSCLWEFKTSQKKTFFRQSQSYSENKKFAPKPETEITLP